jgi:hypothetical protein
VGDAGASALAAALDRGALPRLRILALAERSWLARRCDGQRLRVGGRARCLVQGQARGGGRVRVVTVATRTRVCRRIRAWRCAAVQFWAGSGPPSPVQRGPGRGRAMPRCSMHVAYLRGLEVRMLQPKSSSFSFRRGSRGKESSGGEKKEATKQVVLCFSLRVQRAVLGQRRRGTYDAMKRRRLV